MRKVSPSIVFDKHFTLRNIEKVFIERILHKTGRGIDRITPQKFASNKQIRRENIKIVYRKCKEGTFKFSPYVEILRSKGKQKLPRVISFPTTRDRLVLSCLKDFLHEVFPECVNRKLPNNFVKEVKDFYEGYSENDLYIFKTDIEGFYDTINQEILLDILNKKIRSEKIISLIKKAIQTPTVPMNYRKESLSGDDRKKTKGIPQGLAISNILANIYLYEVDQNFLRQIGLKYFRYVDDIFFYIRAKEKDIIQPFVENLLSTYDLKLNYAKTTCALGNAAFDYLGYRFELPKITVRKETMERFILSIINKFSSYLYNVDTRIKLTPWLTRDMAKQAFLLELNERITGAVNEKKRYGWLFYFQEITDMQLLFKIDSIICKQFERLSDFNNTPPKGLKKLSKAYLESKFNINGGYIVDYNNFDSPDKQIRFLVQRGHIDGNSTNSLTTKQIWSYFQQVKEKNLASLELDVGTIY